jgi:phage N-6-adenine-methyltransferase
MNATTRATLMSSALHEWRTPPALFQQLHAEFAFDLDAAASDDNALCRRYYTERDDALIQPWDGRTYLNPPYGRQLPAFVRKAFAEVACGCCPVAVLLIPARTDTRVWHDCVMQATAVRFLRGRVRFAGATGAETDPAPFPSAVVVMERGQLRQPGGPRFTSMAIPRCAAAEQAVA